MDIANIEKILKETNVNDYDKDLLNQVVKDSIKFVKNCGMDQVAIAYEEVAELEQVITKEIRRKGNRFMAIEEITDVLLGMEFLNAVYYIDVDTDAIYSKLEETSLFIVLKHLTNLQNKILDAILLEEKDGLQSSCIAVLHCIAYLLEYFDISKEEITKMKVFKINRLKERMEQGILI